MARGMKEERERARPVSERVAFQGSRRERNEGRKELSFQDFPLFICAPEPKPELEPQRIQPGQLSDNANRGRSALSLFLVSSARNASRQRQQKKAPKEVGKAENLGVRSSVSSTRTLTLCQIRMERGERPTRSEAVGTEQRLRVEVLRNVGGRRRRQRKGKRPRTEKMFAVGGRPPPPTNVY